MEPGSFQSVEAIRGMLKVIRLTAHRTISRPEPGPGGPQVVQMRSSNRTQPKGNNLEWS
jgi:hypothetical protein